MTSPNSDPTPAAVTVTLVPFTVEVHEDELDQDTLTHEGREAAIREAAHAAAWEILTSGQVELETSVSVPCSGTYADAPGSVGVVCSECGDFSNSEPGLRCGRVD